MKSIIYNGIKFQYDSFSSEHLFSNYYEVTLLNNQEEVAVLTIDQNQLNSL